MSRILRWRVTVPFSAFCLLAMLVMLMFPAASARPLALDLQARIYQAPAHAKPGRTLSLIPPRRSADTLAARRFYAVRPGDSLSSIASALYGRADAWTVIYWANRRHIASPSDILAGQRLVTPPLPARIPAPPAMPAQAPAVAARGSGQPPPPPGSGTGAPAWTAVNYVATPLGQCILNRESGGNYYIWNASGHWGAFQFAEGTWMHYGGSAGSFGSAGPAYQNQIFDNAMSTPGGASNWTPYDGCAGTASVSARLLSFVTQSVTMYDTAASRASLIPPGAAAVAGGGNWTAADFGLFPGAAHIGIAQTARDVSKPVIDFEQKFLFSETGLRQWVLGHQALGLGLGTVYAWRGNLAMVQNALQGLSYYLWVADATGVPHSYPGANVVATQWSNYANGPVPGVDSSTVTDLAALEGQGHPLSHHRHAMPVRLRAYRWAETQAGKAYEWGGTGPWGYDCSGLVMMSYRHAGIHLPRTTYGMLASPLLVRVWKPRMGDLAFYGSGHVELFRKWGYTFGAHDPGSLVGLVHYGWGWVPTMFFAVRQ